MIFLFCWPENSFVKQCKHCSVSLPPTQMFLYEKVVTSCCKSNIFIEVFFIGFFYWRPICACLKTTSKSNSNYFCPEKSKTNECSKLLRNIKKYIEKGRLSKQVHCWEVRCIVLAAVQTNCFVPKTSSPPPPSNLD